MLNVTLSGDPIDQHDSVAGLLGPHTHEGTTIIVSRGDYAPLMQRMCENLDKAKVCVCSVVVMMKCWGNVLVLLGYH